MFWYLVCVCDRDGGGDPFVLSRLSISLLGPRPCVGVGVTAVVCWCVGGGAEIFLIFKK